MTRCCPNADIRLRHEALLRVPAERAFHAARDLDVLRHPLARALITARALPLGRTRPPTLREGLSALAAASMLDIAVGLVGSVDRGLAHLISSLRHRLLSAALDGTINSRA